MAKKAKAKKRVARAKTVTFKIPAYDPGPAIGTVDLTAYEQLDDMVSQLENRILSTVARLKSLGI